MAVTDTNQLQHIDVRNQYDCSSSGGSGSSTFTISGTLTGLATGSQVAIENNGADLTTLSANGTFSFATPVAFDGANSVIVITQLQDFLVEDRPISPVGDHLTGSLAEPKVGILTRPFSCWQVCVL